MEKTYECSCGWRGTDPSITDASSVVERDGVLIVDRTHLLVCPSCFQLLEVNRRERSEEIKAVAD